ncbi:uncharacterized protein CLAFUR5_00832 [Fulvia fulva]|uniref:Nucleolar 27S pre-rRNA processing Urb2/Npa2 C-terminal domain-containing protein n=1 Tax=Passalora fulva TaxID=5499 RepID=A0A9Q8L7E7_PASFU|nr:uncharacterized protein CLAFUR5_00832 [Fulvia fulva]KAK4638082.1 hypothetical protein CLAFUR0_00830 [Fulvia fulva]UJO12192.1 hypothetical protein CLAFUR5_00832 [Fulvia fulva]
MGAPVSPERPSLQRLKALDALPDRDAQLTEAKSLCNHAARAEMITKWVLGKLKSQAGLREKDGPWDLLSFCCRLLSPHKIAVLLGSNGLFDIVHTTFSAADLTARALIAIGGFVHLLFELGQSVHGAAIKSFLSIASTIAATICGKWLHNVHLLTQDTQFGAESDALYLYTDAILQLWTSRKPSAQDDELFNNSCLVDALVIVSRLRDSDALGSQKRKRSGAHARISRERADSLERHIAKHTILPARAAFFKHRQQQARKPRIKASAEEPQSIKERLGSLKMAIWSASDGNALHSVPLVLDIALRSKSAPTPRDRMNERPWLEELWIALRGCFSNQERSVKNQTLAVLLQTLRQQSTTISHQILSAIVKEDVLPADDSSDSVDWYVAAGVVNLDATIFNDRALAQTLFDHITAASSSASHEDNNVLDIRDDIVVPIMKVYGKSRSLRTFMELWGEQLQQEQNFQPKSIWTNINDSFAELVEEALPQAQVLLSIHDSVSLLHETAALSMPTLNTTLVTLEALLRGVRADSTVAKLHDELDELLGNLFTIVELEAFEVHKELPVQLWRLLTRVVAMWYPLRASKQQDQGAIGDRGAALLARKSFRIALAQSTMADTASDRSKRTVEAAQNFVATMCCFFKDVEHKQCKTTCEEGIKTLSNQHELAVDTFIAQPRIFQHLKSTRRKSLFSEVAQDAYDSPNVDQIRAVIAASRSTGGREVLDDMLTVLKERAERQAGQSNAILLSPMQDVGSISLTRAHRVELLNVILEMDDTEANQLPGRLAMMLELASPPCLEAKLFDDALVVWGILSSFDASGILLTHASATILLLEELVNCVLKAWLSTHQRQRSRELLADFSRNLIEHAQRISSGPDKTSPAHCAAIAVVKTAIKVLEGDNAAVVASDLAHRESKHMRSYIKNLLSDADTILTLAEQAEHRVTGSSVAEPLRNVLEAVSSIPESIWHLSGQPYTKASEVVRRTVAVLDARKTDAGTMEMASCTSTACFRLACRYLPDDPAQLTVLAHNALQHKLDAAEYRKVLVEYEARMKSFDHDNKIEALLEFKAARSLTSAHSLALQRAALHSFTAEDVEADKPRMTAIFHDIVEAVSSSHDEHVQRAALVILAEMAKEKSSTVNQYAVERTISVLVQLLQSSSNTNAIYANVCNVLGALFAHHRSRLQGRFHLVIALLQTLLSSLFHKTVGTNEASIRHARSLSKLLETFCNPPQARHSKKSSHLVDEARKAQAHAGQFAQYILHHYCSQILTATLGEGVRDALSPGLWAVIEAIEVNNADGIKNLSAAMNNSERAVLRSVYDDWKRFGKWEGT